MLPTMEAGWLEHVLIRQADAAIRISGADSSSWDGNLDQFRPTLAVKGASGLAWPNGRIQYRTDQVQWPIRAAVSRGRLLDDRTATNARMALYVILHENTHMLAREGRPFRGCRLHLFHEISVEEGVTDLFAHANLDRYVHALGLHTVAPGILGTRHRPSYPGYVAMVNGLLTGVSDVTGSSRRTILGQLATVNPQDKWAELGEMLLLGMEKQVDIPSGERNIVQDRLVTDVKRGIDDTRRLLGDGTQGGLAPKQAARLVQHRLRRSVERALLTYGSEESPEPSQVARDCVYGSPAPATGRIRPRSRSEKIAELRRRSRTQRQGRDGDRGHG